MLFSLLAACSSGDFPIRLERVPDLATGVVLDVTLDEPAAVTGTCVSRDDPDEVLRVDSAEPDADHRIEVLGLLPDEPYRCTLDAGDREAWIDLRTLALPASVPDDWDLTVDDGTTYGAYTLFNHLVGDRTKVDGRAVIVDRDGRVRWYWDFAHYGGDVDTTLTPDGAVILGGGYGLPPTVVGLDGEVRYEASAPAGDGTWHHHVDLQDDGTYYALAQDLNHDPDDSTYMWMGFRIEQRDPATDETLWSWSSQEGVDAGKLPRPTSDGVDAYHANALLVNNPADPDGIWVSMRNLSEIFRLDRATGEITWELGPYTGEFELVTADGSPDASEDWFYGQHAPELDGTTLYVYDNGTGRPGGNSSRAVAYTIDVAARTLTKTWEWTEPDWYEMIWGDVDLLPNGRILVTRGHCPDCTGGNTTSAIVELDPETGPVWRLDAPTLKHMTYRAERLEGCDVFANERYCPVE